MEEEKKVNETRKAMKRRFAEHDSGGLAWRHVFAGVGLDIGPENDPLPGAIPFQLNDGGGDDLTKFFPGAQFDFIHASNIAEHLIDPVLGVGSWISLLKPGGLLVITVPDFLFYEGGVYPSRFNQGHRSTWSMTVDSDGRSRTDFKDASPDRIHCKLPEWFEQFPVEIILCRLITTNYDFSKVGANFEDQTFDAAAGVECFIEVLAKRL